MRSFLLTLGFALILSNSAPAEPEGIKSKLSSYTNDVSSLYESFEMKSLWTDGDELTAKGQALLNHLDTADEDGLILSDYDTPKKLLKGESIDWDHVDVALTSAFIAYLKDLQGRSLKDPETRQVIVGEKTFEDEVEALKAYAASESPDLTWVNDFSPSQPQYLALRKHLIARKLKGEDTKSILINMERWRWMPDLAPTNVIVNIPAYMLYYTEGDSPLLEMKVGVGKTGTRTPIFSAKMVAIVLNPSWYIPNSIMREEYRKQARDSRYFARKGIYSSGGRLVQRPGRGNALGQIKFTIENPFSIYLHGTPAQNIFKQDVRSVSHGCIRLEDPTLLALNMLNDQGWTEDRLLGGIKRGKTQTVPLTNAINTHIMYLTNWVLPDGQLVSYKDVYNRDNIVWKSINTPTRQKKGKKQAP